MRRRRALLVGAAAWLLVGAAGAADRPANRLAGEMSPYLRLHAHNPVDWYPWGEEALARARAEDKPIFLSVGYSTCYWCHVMEREVFSDPEIAALMNRWFVNVKVDREERPELDEIYMTATQLLTGRGGWPNSVFLTPELEPFYAGTYFPPRDRPGLPGFPRVLEGVRDAWRDRREEVVSQAGRLRTAIDRVLSGNAESAGPPPVDAVERVAAALEAGADREWGGFGRKPKFPSPANLRLLWDRAAAGDSAAERVVLDTLGHMGRGAIYDQLDGGFHRYTLDREWRIPHFEKMLYDNAQLGELLALAAAKTGDPELERLGRGTLDFVLSWMTLPSGAFKSAIDAETDAVEGAYYVWTGEELRRELGEAGFSLVGPIFGFTGEPNFEGHHHTLFLTAPLDEHARRLGLTRPELLARLEPELAKLRRARARREFPLVDDKVLVDWNGMMVAALARAGSLLEEERYLEAAGRAARFLLTLRDPDGALLHVWRGGEARIAAFLDDYVFLIDGLLALEEAGVDGPWLAQARRLAEEMETRLAAPGGGYYASEDAPDLLVRSRPGSDSAVPAGNGVAALALLRLAELTGEPVYRLRVARALGAFAADFEAGPQGLPTLARALRRFHLSAAPARAEERLRIPSGQELARTLVEARGRWNGESRRGWRLFELELSIAEGWHVNANPASLDFLLPTAVEGAVRDVAYPAGESFRFQFADDEVEVYSGRVTLTGEAESGASAVEVVYQACDDRRCLPPVALEVSLEADPEVP